MFAFGYFLVFRSTFRLLRLGSAGRAVASPRKTESSSEIRKFGKSSPSSNAVSGQTLADLQVRKWQLVSAVCLERPPIVSAAKTAIEEEFSTLLDQQEFELSLLSDHERTKFDDGRKRKKKDGETVAEEEIVMETAQDLEDNWNEQLQKFSPQSRLTEEDASGNLKSLNRKLDRKLYLATQQVLGESPQWVFPQGPWQKGESLRETAERAIRTTCGEELSFDFLGSAPCGWYKYKYPATSEISKEYYGAKVFFFKALLDVKKSKDVLPSKNILTYKWLTREELEAVFIAKYYDRVERFMFEFNGAGVPVNADHDGLVRLQY